MKVIAVNYNFVPNWIPEFTDDYLIYDRSDSAEYLKDFDQSKIIKTANIGNVDYDKLGYLIDNYDNLPEVFLWTKSNLFKFITKEEFDLVKDNKVFTPLLTQNHRTYSDQHGIVCFYEDGMYYERNDSWYMWQFDNKYATSWLEWSRLMLLPNPPFIPFAPGGSYILTRETVRKYAKEYYEDMRSTLDYTMLPAEAHLAERSYWLMWK